MAEGKVENGRIEATHLGPEGHGILTAVLTVAYPGGQQTFGGYDLRGERRCAEFVQGVLNVFGVDSWERVKGQYVRTRVEGGRIVAIGHIVENRWYEPFPEPKPETGETRVRRA